MIKKEEIKNIIQLARLAMSDKEEELVEKNLSNILNYIGQIQSLDIGSIKTDNVSRKNIVREDIAIPHNGDLISYFKQKEGRLLKVKKII